MSNRRTIDANGNLVFVDEPASSINGATDVSAGESNGLFNSLQSIQTVDVFGFLVPLRQCWIGLAVIMILLGPWQGTVSRVYVTI